jgi:sirohydrochlorin cobaltochelatase
MASDADVKAVLDAIEPEIRPGGVPTVLACHGNASFAAYNDRIMAMARMAEERWPSVVVASVEGDHPGLAPLARAREMAARAGSAHFVPMLLVAGGHVMKDVMGAGPESWKSRVGAAESTCAKALGQNDRVLDVYFNHLDAALASLGN